VSEPTNRRRTALPLLIGVLIVVVLAEVAARLVMAQTTDAIRWYDATAQLKVEQMEELGGVEVVFAGTSMAQQAFVPSVFDEATGTKSWNAGLAGGTPEVMSPWLLEEVVPRLQPSTVVWGLSSFDLAPAYGPAQAEVYEEALETRDGWLAAADRAVSSGSVLVRNRAVLRSLDALAGAAAHERGVAHAEAERITGADGERTEQTADVGEQRGRIVAARLANFTPHPDDLDLIATTVRSLEADGIDVVLVQLPVPDRFRDAHPNGNADHALVGPALAELAAELDVRFLQLLDAAASPDFVDFTHLDASSAAELSRSLAAAYESDRNDTAATLERSALLGLDTTATTAAEEPTSSADEVECVPEIVQDDYGFEIDIANCGVVVPDLAELESVSSRDVLANAFVFAPPCEARGDPARISEDIDTEQRSRILRALELRADAAASCDSADFAELLSGAITELELAVGIDRAVIDVDDPTEASSRILAAMDELRLPDTPEDGAANPPRSPWHSYEELRTQAEIRRLQEAGTPIDTFILGSSIALQMLDQRPLAEYYGESVLNISKPGIDPESWLAIYGRQFDTQPAPERVIWGLTTHRLVSTHPTPCEDPGPNLSSLRSAWFRDNMFPHLQDAFDETEIIFGQDYATSPIRETRAFERLSNGYEAPGLRILRENDFDSLPQGFVRRYRNGVDVCQKQVDDAGRLVAEMVAAGTEVIVVSLPVHFSVIDLAPDAHADANAALEAAVTAAGGEYLEIDEQLGDAETHDGWHAREAGRSRVTAELIELLAAG
jgi:hypothetical protein